MLGQPGHKTQPPARLVPSFLGKNAWMTSQLNVFSSQATWVIDVLGLCFDMLSMGVLKNRHWHTSGRLVQELNLCTVGALFVSTLITVSD